MSRVELRLRTNQGTVQAQVDLDGVTAWSGSVTAQAQDVVAEFTDVGEHVLTITMQGKTPQHTFLDPNGGILDDVVLLIESAQINTTPIGDIMHRRSLYRHNYNSSGDAVEQAFFGSMGCNGTVIMQFESPVDLWLLENL